MIDRNRIRAAVSALLQVLAFVLSFAALHFAVSSILLALTSLSAIAIDGISVLVSAIGVGAALLWLWERKPVSELGFSPHAMALPQLAGGLALGAAGLGVACVVLLLVGALQYRPDTGSPGNWFFGMVNMLFALLIPAAGEEALFRGYPFQKLVAGFGPIAATLGASALFAVAHANNPSVNSFALVNIFVAGVMLSIAYLRTRSLWFASGVHLGWNWSMAALLDLPVSGLELFDAPLYEPVDRGPAWLSGGAFGPEAGIAGLLGLLLVLAGVVWFTRKTQWVRSIESQ